MRPSLGRVTHYQKTASQTQEGRSLLIRRKVSLGSPVPRLNFLAFVRGQYMFLDRSALSRRWIALCFPGSLHAGAIRRLNVQADALAREGAVMLLTFPDARLLRLASRGVLQRFTSPIMTDSLYRLHRSYGVKRRSPFLQPTTFVIDPDRILRLELNHALDSEDLDVLRGIIHARSSKLLSNDESPSSQKGEHHVHVMCAR